MKRIRKLFINYKITKTIKIEKKNIKLQKQTM